MALEFLPLISTHNTGMHTSVSNIHYSLKSHCFYYTKCQIYKRAIQVSVSRLTYLSKVKHKILLLQNFLITVSGHHQNYFEFKMTLSCHTWHSQGGYMMYRMEALIMSVHCVLQIVCYNYICQATSSLCITILLLGYLGINTSMNSSS